LSLDIPREVLDVRPAVAGDEAHLIPTSLVPRRSRSRWPTIESDGHQRGQVPDGYDVKVAVGPDVIQNAIERYYETAHTGL